MTDFGKFTHPLFSVRTSAGRIKNFGSLAEALSYRDSFSPALHDLLSIEVFEYGF